MWSKNAKHPIMDFRTVNQEFSLVGLHLRPSAMKKIMHYLNSEAKGLVGEDEEGDVDFESNQENEAQNSRSRAQQLLDGLITSVKLYVQRMEKEDIPKFLDETFIQDVMSWAKETKVVYNKKAHLGDGVFVYDAFRDIPKYKLVDEQMVEINKMHLFAGPEEKVNMIRERMRKISDHLFAPGSGYLKNAHSSETNRYDFLRGHSRKYVTLFPAIGIRPSPTDEFSLGSDLQDGDLRARGLGTLKRGDVFDVLEWRVKVDQSWFLKIKIDKITGWVPYRHPKKEGITRLPDAMVGPYYGPPGSKTACLITSVESLRGNPGPKVTVGYLTKIGDQWLLEDAHEAVPIDMTYVASTSEFITRGAFIVAEGFVDNRDSIFRVEKIWHPPMPTETMRSLNERNVFGGNHTREDLLNLAEMTNDDFYVILSEVHLDNEAVLAKLELVFQKFEDSDELPSYILMGNFSATPFNPHVHNTMERWQEIFSNFSELLRKYSHTMMKRIILIPGPEDPFSRGLLPSKPLPRFVDDFPENVILATNPCRIRHTYKKIIICRQDLSAELNRNQVIPIQVDSEKQKVAYVKYLGHQAHLRPLPISENPVTWSFDQSLSLEEWPDVLLMGDKRKPFDLVYSNCAFACISSFKQSAISNWSFYIYRPSEKLEDSLQVQFAVNLFEGEEVEEEEVVDAEEDEEESDIDADGDVIMGGY